MKPAPVSKYEATKCMKQHIVSVHNSEPSKETSRWRTAPSYANPSKQSKQQQYHKMDETINEKNRLLSERLYKVVTEDRVHRTKEAGPGWRSGVENKQVLYYKKFRNENRERALQWKQHQLNEANVNFYSYLAATKTSYGVDQLAKEYKKNRVSYDLYANRPHTALTLGIYDVAAKEIAKEKLKREGYRANLNYSSSELNQKIEEMWNKKKEKGTSKTIKKLQDVKTVADFIEMNVASIEEKWNPAVNDNLRNSDSNFIMVENRLKPGYVGKKEFHSNYLSDVPSASQTIRNSTAVAAVDGRRGSGGMRVDYDHILFDESDYMNQQHQQQQQQRRSQENLTMLNNSSNINSSSSGGIKGRGKESNQVNAATDERGGGAGYESFEFNLYETKGSHQHSHSPPPLRHSSSGHHTTQHNSHNSRSSATSGGGGNAYSRSAASIAQARPTSGGTMQYADTRGTRDLTQYQHSIEEVSEFNFQNLKAEYLEHFMEAQQLEQQQQLELEASKRLSNEELKSRGAGSSPSQGKRPHSAGPTLMKVHHTRATAAAVEKSLLPAERPVTPKYALPKLPSPTNRSGSPTGTTNAASAANSLAAGAAHQISGTSAAEPPKKVTANLSSGFGSSGGSGGSGGVPRVGSTSPSSRRPTSSAVAPAAATITFHSDPLECVQVENKTNPYDQLDRRNHQQHQQQRQRPQSSSERSPSTSHRTQMTQRPHSSGGGSRQAYKDYSGNAMILGGGHPSNSKKNVSFDNKLDSTIILDYSQTSDSVAAAAIAAVNGGAIGSSSSSTLLEENNIMFINQY